MRWSINVNLGLLSGFGTTVCLMPLELAGLGWHYQTGHERMWVLSFEFSSSYLKHCSGKKTRLGSVTAEWGLIDELLAARVPALIDQIHYRIVSSASVASLVFYMLDPTVVLLERRRIFWVNLWDRLHFDDTVWLHPPQPQHTLHLSSDALRRTSCPVWVIYLFKINSTVHYSIDNLMCTWDCVTSRNVITFSSNLHSDMMNGWMDDVLKLSLYMTEFIKVNSQSLC